MIKPMQRCQNCRFFKRTWEKVQKSAEVPTYLDYNELYNDEKAEVTLHYNEPHLRPLSSIKYTFYSFRKIGRQDRMGQTLCLLASMLPIFQFV